MKNHEFTKIYVQLRLPEAHGEPCATEEALGAGVREPVTSEEAQLAARAQGTADMGYDLPVEVVGRRARRVGAPQDALEPHRGAQGARLLVAWHGRHAVLGHDLWYRGAEHGPFPSERRRSGAEAGARAGARAAELRADAPRPAPQLLFINCYGNKILFQIITEYVIRMILMSIFAKF
jgi:hypothetical protein